MKWHLATDKQLRTIIEDDREIPSLLLYQVLEEATKRDLYRPLIRYFVKKHFKGVDAAELITDTPFEDIKQLCYIEMFEAAKRFKPGKCSFISFWYRFVRTKFMDISKAAQTQKREVNRLRADTTNKDTKEEYIQIVSDTNVEKTVVNKMYLDYLFQFVKPQQLEVLQLMRKGYRVVDVAEILGLNIKMIDKRFRDGKKRIVGGLKDELSKIV